MQTVVVYCFWPLLQLEQAMSVPSRWIAVVHSIAQPHNAGRGDKARGPGFGVEGVAVAVWVHIKKCRDHRVARIFLQRE